MNKNASLSRRIIWVIVFIFAVFIFAYFAGYRFDANTLKAISPGKITLDLPVDEATILLGDATAGISKIGMSQFKMRFVPAGIQKVSVTKEGFWPWQKVINVESGKEIILKPILISQSPSGEVINNDDPLYKTLRDKILLESTSNQVLSSDSTTSLEKASSTLRAKWSGINLKEAPFPFCTYDGELNVVEDSCVSEVIAFRGEENIRSIGFYRNRNDVAVIAVKNGVYAIELGSDDFQNFQPIYKGKKPSFTIDNGNIYILDEEALMQLHW